MNPLDLLPALPPALRIPTLLLLAVGAQLLVKAVQRAGQAVAAPAAAPGQTASDSFAKRYPKLATVSSLTASGLTFTIYFVALGLILSELGVSLTAYLASASVVGLAVAFGSQGLVQDVVIGLTLVFSDAFDVGDTIEVTGHIGRVERMGLRFTTLVNFLGQRVYVPNRNILTVSRYRRGAIRAYADLQVPENVSEETFRALVEPLAMGMRSQYRSIVLGEPEIFGVFPAEPGGWRYLRVKFRLWPGQGTLIETTFRKRVLAAVKTLDPDYQEWMVSVTYRVV